jgi:PIN domain nuclease of toxin-antitoxin system
LKALVDTHALLWWLAGDDRLSPRAHELLADSAHQRLVSTASLWEIAIKFNSGRLTAAGLTLREIAQELQRQRFLLLPVRLEDLLRLEELPWLHRDPFDRLILAQAIQEAIPLLTADRLITQYQFETIW